MNNSINWNKNEYNNSEENAILAENIFNEVTRLGIENFEVYISNSGLSYGFKKNNCNYKSLILTEGNNNIEKYSFLATNEALKYKAMYEFWTSKKDAEINALNDKLEKNSKYTRSLQNQILNLLGGKLKGVQRFTKLSNFMKRKRI